jgi:MoaA/NifB/PqqE/SkfB family radical SAM enzyme
LACDYCYSSKTPKTILETGTALRIIDELLNEKWLFYLTIAGGEPLAHPGILEIITHSFTRYFGRVQLLSNATRLCNDNFFSKFSEICEVLHRNGTPLNIQVSVDSVDTSIHNLHRGKGRLVMLAIDRLLSLPVHVQLGCVITNDNVNVADQIIEYYYPRISNFHFMNLILAQGGGDYERWRGIRPATFDALVAFHKKILQKEVRFPGIRVTKLIDGTTETIKGTMKGKGCLAGITRIDIEANLDIKACCMADSLMGNLGRQSFEDIWHSEAAEQIRSKTEALCVAPNYVCS